MHGKVTPRIVRNLNRNARAVIVGALFLFFSVLIYISLCTMPCENAQLADHMEEHDHGTPYEDVKKFATSKKHNAFLVISILSAPKHFAIRNAIRTTWLAGLPKHILPYFVIGTGALSYEEKRTLDYENSHTNDLLLLPKFNDSYSMLSYKIIETFSLIDRNVAFEFLLKIDDDSFAQVDAIAKELHSMPTERLYWGFFDGRARVRHTGKWQERKWVLCDTYLPYARGGGYVLSADLVHYIVKNSNYLQKFQSEDVSVGAWLGPLDINRIHDPRFDTEYRSRGCHNDYIITHKQSPDDMQEKMRSLRETGLLCPVEFRTRYSYIYNWDAPSSQCCHRLNDSSVP